MINKTKWGFATLTALTLMFSQGAGAVTQAFAADGTTAQTQTTTTTSGTSTNTGSAINTTSGSTTDANTQVKAGILPDNFFYFVKMMIEKVDFAFASNNTEKAKLLSQFAAERIAEANALIAKGETDKAAQTLQQAIDQQNLALSLTNPTSSTTSTSGSTATPTTSTSGSTATPTNGSDATSTSTTTNGTINGTSGDASSTTATSQSGTTSTSADQGSAVNTTNGTASTTDQTSGTTAVSSPTTPTSSTTGSALPTSTQDLNKVDPRVAHNITALLKALQHIKNPRAQEALMKNIEKTFARLGFKLDKLQNDQEKHQLADFEKDGQDVKATNDQTKASATTQDNQTQVSATNQDDHGENSTKAEADHQDQPKHQEDAVKEDVKQATTKAAHDVKHKVEKAKAETHNAVTKGYEKAQEVKSHAMKRVNEFVNRYNQEDRQNQDNYDHGSDHNGGHSNH